MNRDNQRWPVSESVIAEKSLDSSEWEVTLKDGTKIDARVALAELKMLRSVLCDNPALIEQLVGAARNGDEVGDEAAREFCDDQGLQPAIKAILLNSALHEEDRLVLEDPFMTPEQDADIAAHNEHVLNTANEARIIGLDRLFAELETERRGDGQEPSR